MKKLECIECGSVATEQHHVIPKSMGGTSTVPLCGTCHARVHNISGTRRDQSKYLTWAGFLRSSSSYAHKYACFLIWYTWSGETNRPQREWPALIAEFTGYDEHISMSSIKTMLWRLQHFWNEGEERLFDPLVDALDSKLADVVRDTIPQFLGT